MERATPAVGREELTERQREVLQLIARGRTNAEIADELGISLDGAKYHVREILGRLGVESREEAAEWWRANGRRSRIGSMPRLLALPAWRWLGAGGAVAALGIGAVAIDAAFRSGGSAPAPAAASATSGAPAPSPTPTADLTFSPRDPAWVLANGTPVDFDVCETITGWRHPTLDEVLGAPGSYLRVRWGATTNHDLAPAYYGAFLAHFTYVTSPNANSARIEWAALSGIDFDPNNAAVRIDRCQSLPWGTNTQELWMSGYAPVAARRLGSQLVVEVEAAPGAFHVMDFEAAGPPLTPQTGKGEPESFQQMDVILAGGQRLYAGGASTTQQYDAAGSLEFAHLFGSTPTGLHVPQTMAFNLIAQSKDDLNARSALLVTDSATGAEQTVPFAKSTELWTPAATITLAPGDYEVRVENGIKDFLLLPANTPPP